MNKAQRKKAKRHIKNADCYNEKGRFSSKYARKRTKQKKNIYSSDSPKKLLPE